jgi:hypothetical protein
MGILSTIFAPFVALGVALGSLLVPTPEPQLGASQAVPTTIAFFETTLAAPITATSTSFTLSSATDKDGNVLASSTYGFVIDEGSSNVEIVLADCTGTSCTNAVRGVSVTSGNASVVALKKSHRRGASVKITDAPILVLTSRALRGEDVTDFIPTGNGSLVNKQYVDSVALGDGAVPSTYLDDGILELATGTQAASSTATDESGSPLALHTAISTSTAPASGSYVVVTGADGKIDDDFLVLEEQNTLYFGDGSDGNFTVSTTTTLTSDKFYNNLTVNGTLNTDGYRVFVMGTLSGTGTIANNNTSAGGDGGVDGTGVGGTAGPAKGSGPLKGVAGVVGGSGGDTSPQAAAGTNGLPGTKGTTTGAYGGAGGFGYLGDAGGATSTGGVNTNKSVYNLESIHHFSWYSATGTPTLFLPTGSGSGGGGEGRNSVEYGAGGGGSGGSGGVILLVAKTWAGTFTISATGANGGVGGTKASNYYGGGGGGGGGTGGTVFVLYKTKTWSGSYNLAGGTGGAGGTAVNDGGPGGRGQDGPTGVYYEYDVDTF